MVVSSQFHAPAALFLEKYFPVDVWVGTSAGLNTMNLHNFCPCREANNNPPAVQLIGPLYTENSLAPLCFKIVTVNV
jgi:hypothetical protein